MKRSHKETAVTAADVYNDSGRHISRRMKIVSVDPHIDCQAAPDEHCRHFMEWVVRTQAIVRPTMVLWRRCASMRWPRAPRSHVMSPIR